MAKHKDGAEREQSTISVDPERMKIFRKLAIDRDRNFTEATGEAIDLWIAAGLPEEMSSLAPEDRALVLAFPRFLAEAHPSVVDGVRDLIQGFLGRLNHASKT
jgi:hypothetical protein